MKQALHDVLKTVCPRVHPVRAPHTTPTPYVTFQAYGGISLDYLGNDEPGNRNATVQINVWSDDPEQADAVMRGIETALRVAEAFSASPLGAPRDADDPDMELFGASQDFNIWIQE